MSTPTKSHAWIYSLDNDWLDCPRPVVARPWPEPQVPSIKELVETGYFDNPDDTYIEPEEA